MKTETKVLFGVLIALLVALPVISYTTATPELTADDTGIATSNPPNEAFRRQILKTIVEQRMERRGAVARWFFRNAEPITIEGSVAANLNRILVINSEEEMLNILLPRQWSVNDQVYAAPELFEQGILAGEVTIEALKSIIENEQGVVVSVIVAYEITAGENVLHAVMPINIEA